MGGAILLSNQDIIAPPLFIFKFLCYSNQPILFAPYNLNWRKNNLVLV